MMKFINKYTGVIYEVNSENLITQYKKKPELFDVVKEQQEAKSGAKINRTVKKSTVV